MLGRVHVLGLAVGLICVASLPARAATIVVTTLADPGSFLTCSLRQAITNANRRGATRSGCAPGTRVNTIIFAPGLTGTLAIKQKLPDVTGTLTIIGPTGSKGVTIDGLHEFPPEGLMALTPRTNLTLQNLTFNNGLALGGGAITNTEGTLSVSNCTFNNNKAGAFYGGAINNDGALLLTDSTFVGNAAPDWGGALANFGDATIAGCTFSENRGYIGSAVANLRDSTTIINSTFSGNLASTGGAIFQYLGSTRIFNSTFANNSAIGLGGRALIVGSGAAVVKGSIFISGDEHNCSGEPITDEGYNVSSDSSCNFNGTGSLNDTDPGLDPAGLAENGGPTETIALTASSPADELIPVASCTDQNGAPLTVDQRGYGRPATSHADFCSAGAYEFDAEP